MMSMQLEIKAVDVSGAVVYFSYATWSWKTKYTKQFHSESLIDIYSGVAR